MRRYTLHVGDREFTVDVEDLAADRFAVQVGEASYEVRLTGDEDLSRASITPQFAPQLAPRTAAAAAAPGTPRVRATSATAAPPPRPAAAGAGGDALKAPMPGVILEVLAKVGDVVERGQDLAVLEAMKMQNAIRAPRAGRIAQVWVAAGQQVGFGDPLFAFDPA
jgi:biotin carboxyl carrier protein